MSEAQTPPGASAAADQPDLLQSLLTAIVRADGDALVMHVGDPPYVVAPAGSVELSDQPVTAGAMDRLLGQLLPVQMRRGLAATGAVEYEFQTGRQPRGDRFKLVAVREGDDVWTEIRRYRDPSVMKDAAPRPAEPRPAAAAIPDAGPAAGAVPDVPPAVVLSMPRAAPRVEPPPGPGAQPMGLERLLRLAMDRGGSALYVLTAHRPFIRLNGEVVPLDGERALEETEVQALMLELPATREEAGWHGEWVGELAQVGRIRCIRFDDQRGPGAIFRMVGSRPPSVEQLGLSRDVRALVAGDGLVLIAGQRRAGKSSLLSALIDSVNSHRHVHIVSVEREIRYLHQSRQSVVSQREVRGSEEDFAAAIRNAIRERPDVLAVDDVHSGEVAEVVLDAATGGGLVLAVVPASNACAAVRQLLEQLPGSKPHGPAQLASVLRGIVAQVRLAKTSGGDVAARELLLGTEVVRRIIAERRLDELPAALEGGRKDGMVPLNDALVGFVQAGAIEAWDAYRHTPDPEGLLVLLKRSGVDTSFAERRA